MIPGRVSENAFYFSNGGAVMKRIKKYLDGTLTKLYIAADKELSKSRVDGAMVALSSAARILYAANQVYTDNTGETLLARIVEKLPAPAPRKSTSGLILFYDGFGFNNRGLVQIYLKALSKCGKLLYVTHERAKGTLPDVMGILESCGGETVWLGGSTMEALSGELARIFDEYAPENAFLYTMPNDVAGIAVFQKNAGLCHRYQVNLTDHAYWLGTAAFDTCIEFRDYGASLSRDQRNIPESKLAKLPFYPAINFDAPFQGYPFPVPEGAKVVFSGGSLYKTMGGENRYYKMADYILKSFPEAIFWYAGTGDASQLDLLKEKYPDRLYHTAERSDLYQVLENSFLYLSTYPLCGGLMFQYAASAGKIPVTLRYDNVSDDFLLDQDHLGIQFETLEQVCEELQKLFTDEAYLAEKQRKIKASVLDQAAFEAGLSRLLTQGQSGYPITFKVPDTKAFREESLKSLTKNTIAQYLINKKSKCLARYMPMRCLRGLVYKVKCKLEAKWK